MVKVIKTNNFAIAIKQEFTDEHHFQTSLASNGNMDLPYVIQVMEAWLKRARERMQNPILEGLNFED